MPDNQLNKKTQAYVRERAGECCEYCMALSNYAFHPFSIDHINPISKGGNNDIDNLAWACFHCNGAKYNKVDCSDPLSNEVVSLYNPHLNTWSEHFVWNDNQTIIIGITPIGRATVSCLKVNRQGAVNLREALRDFGVHPPKFVGE